jgi:starch synthase
MQPGSLRTSVFRGKIDGIPVLLLRPDWGSCNIFRGGRIYGGSYNELEAYLYFSRSALQTTQNSHPIPFSKAQVCM